MDLAVPRSHGQHVSRSYRPTAPCWLRVGRDSGSMSAAFRVTELQCTVQAFLVTWLVLHAWLCSLCRLLLGSMPSESRGLDQHCAWPAWQRSYRSLGRGLQSFSWTGHAFLDSADLTRADRSALGEGHDAASGLVNAVYVLSTTA
jgi:hypothetical protein